MTSITQRQPPADRPSGLRALTEPRVDPGRNVTNPERVSGPSKLSTMIPKGQNNTGREPRMPVKR